MKLFLKTAAFILVAVAALTVLSSCGAKKDGKETEKEAEKVTLSDDFEFCLQWSYSSSYDSATGRLVKAGDPKGEDRFATELILTGDQRAEIKKLIEDAYFFSLPSKLHNTTGVAVEPQPQLKMTVTKGGVETTVEWVDFARRDYGDDNGKRFYDLTRAIIEIITSTEEYESIPELDFGYL